MSYHAILDNDSALSLNPLIGPNLLIGSGGRRRLGVDDTPVLVVGADIGVSCSKIPPLFVFEDSLSFRL